MRKNKFLSMLAVDMQRAVFSWGFLSSVLLTALSFMAMIYTDMKELSLVNAVYLMEFGLRYNNYYPLMIFLGTLPYAASFANEEQSRALPFIQARSGKARYAWAKSVAVFCSSMLSVCLGLMLPLAYVLLTHNAYPTPQESVITEILMPLIQSDAPWLYFVIALALAGLNAAFWALLAQACSLIIPQSYVVYATPIISYQLILAVNRLFKWTWFLNPGTIGNLRYYTPEITLGVGLALSFSYIIALCVVCALVFVHFVKRRDFNAS